MANVKISQLPTATSLSIGDLVPVVQGGVTKQATPDLLPLSTAATTALAGKVDTTAIGTAASHAATDFDTVGAAAAAQAYAIQRGNHTGTQPTSTVTGLDTVLAAKADLVAGVIPSGQIPALALTNAVTVVSQAAMLALTSTQVQPGDVAVRTDGAGTFILTATDPTVLGNWTRLNAPTDAVTTVNGQAGTVVLAATDVGAAPASLSTTVATNTSNIATNTTAIAGKAPLLTPTATKTAPYTVAASELAMMNVAGGATTLTLPTAPADRTIVGYRAIGATTAVPLTINRGGSTDTIGTTGAITASIPLADEIAVLQYDAANTRWLGISNIKTQASLDNRYPTLTNGRVAASKVTRSPVLAAVATRNNPLGQGTQAPNAGLSVTYKSQHTINVDCYDIRLQFANFQYASSGANEADGANNLTVKAAIELVSGGTRRPFCFNGVRAATVEPGFTATTDPFPYSFKAGDTFWIWTNVSIASGTWPIGLQIQSAQAAAANSPYPTFASGEGSNFSANTGDITLSGTITAQSMNAYTPSAIIGRTTNAAPSVAMIGDSIMAGFGDSPTYDWGFVPRALQPAKINYINLSHKGETASQYATASSNLRRNRMLEFITHAIVNYGTNDLATNTYTGLQVAANLVTIWKGLAVRGVPVYQTTICPRTTSTDAWATTANQTVVAGCGQPRTDLNTWLRAGAPVDPNALTPVAVGTVGAIPCPYLTGVFDTAATVEDATQTLWKATAVQTADGVHPNTTAHTAMAAAITPTLFTV